MKRLIRLCSLLNDLNITNNMLDEIIDGTNIYNAYQNGESIESYIENGVEEIINEKLINNILQTGKVYTLGKELITDCPFLTEDHEKEQAENYFKERGFNISGLDVIIPEGEQIKLTQANGVNNTIEVRFTRNGPNSNEFQKYRDLYVNEHTLPTTVKGYFELFGLDYNQLINDLKNEIEMKLK